VSGTAIAELPARHSRQEEPSMRANGSKPQQLLLLLALLSGPGLLFTGASTAIGQSAASPASETSPLPPNNSGKNVRDRERGAVTPFTQSNNRSDVEITRKIRRALMEDKSLSTTARNVKVITVDGNVILRGPVKSKHEKAAIADKAVEIAGAGHVSNQLEIAGR
jgi:hyperosmotically inducible periplasmic protein